MCLYTCIYMYVMHICIYIYVCTYIVCIYIYTQTPESSSHSMKKPDAFRQATSSSVGGKWRSFPSLYLITSPSVAFCGQLWLQCERELRFPSGHAQAPVRLGPAEEQLYGMHARTAFCRRRRQPGPPSASSPPSSHEIFFSKSRMSMDAVRREHILCLVLKCLLE